MAQRQSIEATLRTIIGKDTKKLRRVGEVPGVVYGPVVSDPISVTVNMRELDRMYTSYGSTMLVDVKLNGSSYTTYMRHIQIDRLKNQPIHIEFFAPNMRVAITVKVPVILVGEPGHDDSVVTMGDGMIELSGLPDALPAAVEVDVSVLTEIDQAIHVRDLTFADGVEVIGDLDEMVVKLSAPTLPEPDDEPEATEGDEAVGADQVDAGKDSDG